VLLLLVNVKENRLFYALHDAYAEEASGNTVQVPVTPVDERTKDELRHLLTHLQSAASQVLHG
jgi:hypothetical protein